MKIVSWLDAFLKTSRTDGLNEDDAEEKNQIISEAKYFSRGEFLMCFIN